MKLYRYSTFKLFEKNIRKIVYRSIDGDFDPNYNGIQYYCENKNYAKIFGNNIKSFYINEIDVMYLDDWNNKLSKKTKERYDNHLFTIHETYLNKNSENYGYIGLRNILISDINYTEFINFQKEFSKARIIKGRDSGNESEIVYAVIDNNLIEEIK
jgi:hypothetical protein